MREREKALLLEWLITLGKDWVRFDTLSKAGFQFEMGTLERMGYAAHNLNERYDAANEVYRVKYRLTEKALALLKEDDRE